MKNLKEINIPDLLKRLQEVYKKIRKIHIILFFILLIASVVGFIYAKDAWKEYYVTKGAQEIITKVSQSQRETKKKTGKYTHDLFADKKLVSALKLSSKVSSKSNENSKFGKNNTKYKRRFAMEDEDEDMDNFPSRSSKTRSKSSSRNSGKSSGKGSSDPNIGQSGDYYIEIDAENACMIVKYKRFTPEKTIFYAFFEDGKPYCQGENCKVETNNDEVDLCYLNGMCFAQNLIHETERECGDGHGIQKRKCTKSCNGGNCEGWGECVCNKGYGWDGKTCAQLQTEKDCSEEQCFNGVYCEDPENLEKEIEHGTCKRLKFCQVNKGWQYSSWDCSCDKTYYCPVKDECVIMPEPLKSIELSNQAGSCSNISYRCEKNKGWQNYAESCVCDNIGTFWDEKSKKATCSSCTKKPVNAEFTSNAIGTDSCSWKCKEGFELRKNDCTKPDGQYLCAKTDLQICTDDFSKSRKLKINTKTNEGQLCYSDEKDHILFFDQKNKVCTLCQCVNVDAKKNNK